MLRVRHRVFPLIFHVPCLSCERTIECSVPSGRKCCDQCVSSVITWPMILARISWADRRWNVSAAWTPPTVSTRLSATPTAHHTACRVWSFLGPLTPAPLVYLGVIALHDMIPVDVLHERLDIRRRLRPIIDVIGVFVHVEGEDRHPTRQTARMIRRPLIDQLGIPRGVHQEDPAGAPAQRLPHGHELALPALVAPEIPCERLAQRGIRRTLSAQTVKVEFVENHRIGRDEFLALQTIDDKDGRSRDIQRGELVCDRIQAAYG